MDLWAGMRYMPEMQGWPAPSLKLWAHLHSPCLMGVLSGLSPCRRLHSTFLLCFQSVEIVISYLRHTILLHIHIYVCVYIYRERERESSIYTYTLYIIYNYIFYIICIYYIYVIWFSDRTYKNVYIYKKNIYIEYIVHIFFNNKPTLKLSDIWLWRSIFLSHIAKISSYM